MSPPADTDFATPSTNAPKIAASAAAASGIAASNPGAGVVPADQTASADAPPDAQQQDRRRPGRLAIDNPHLIELLRAPRTPLPQIDEHRPDRIASLGFLPVIAAAILFWAVAIHLLGLV